MERNRSPHKAISIVRSRGRFVKQKAEQNFIRNIYSDFVANNKILDPSAQHLINTTLLALGIINATIKSIVITLSKMSKKLRATELFLSLGLAATLVTGCGAPEEGGEAVEGDTDVEVVEPEAVEPEVEGGEGDEGGEGGEG